MSFANKNVIVTGAAGDIGRAVTTRLLASGANVLAVDFDAEALNLFLEGFPNNDGRLVIHVADVRDPMQVAAYAARAADLWGPVDAFFNNAGIQIPVAMITDLDETDFDRVMAVNVRGIFLGLKYVLPRMREGGAVLNSSSALGLVAAPGVSAYVTAKHAIIGLTRAAALEQGARKVRVNAIAPGPIAGRMTFTLEEEIFGANGPTFAASVPLGRHGTPEDVAAMAAFLLSDESLYVSGAVHVIDGGFTAA